MAQLRAAGDGPQARKLLDTLFRSVHNLKARAAANGLTKLACAAHEFENVLQPLRKQAVQQSLAEGAKLFLVQTDFDVSHFEQQFQSLKERLTKTGEVISTEPSVNKERPGKVNFRILYAATDAPTHLSVAFEEVSATTPEATSSLAQRMPMLEIAFAKLAAELVTIPDDDVLGQAMRAGETAARTTGKHVDFEVRGEAALLNQLPSLAAPLLHLIRNAVDHGIEAEGKVIIEITTHHDQLRIAVTDNGRGIDPTVIDHIFEPGFSTAREISELSGRGVGLDAVKTSIEALEGSINVHSAPGQGSTFELTLPIRSAQHPR